MSLTVPPELFEQLEHREIDPDEFARVIKSSLPRGWQVIEDLAARLSTSENDLESYGTNPMDEETRGELLRILAGNALRDTVEKHFGVHLAFQNCHNVAVVKEDRKEAKPVKDFKSIKSQIKGQKPELKHC